MICMIKWVINGIQSGKMFKTLVMCCVLGKYNPSYSCLFWVSYETVEIDFPFVEMN